jgi:non-specific serine/threonine protein kinase
VGGTSAPARQHTLRATLDWSYELLGPPERHLFTRLAPFAGGWRLEDAEAICASDDLLADAVVERLAKLVDQSLVVVHQPSGETRYRLLDTVRHYAADRLNEDGLAESAYTAHRDHYLAEAEREPAERYSIAHIEWLSREADNLRAALRWSIDRDEFDVAFRLAAALQGVWYVRGWLSEGRAWLNELVDRAGPAIESVQGARAIGAAARLVYMQGDLASAASLADRCWQLADRLGDARGLALATTRRAVVARGYGDLARARALSEEALRRSRAVADVDLQVFSLYSSSAVQLDLEDLEAAAELAGECLALAESVDHAWGISSAHRVLGLAEQHSPRVARQHLEESLAWSTRLGYAQGTVYATIGLGRLDLAGGDALTADGYFREALKLALELGDQLEIVHCLEGLTQTRDAGSGVPIAAAAAALRDVLGAAPTPAEHDRLQPWLDTARRTLGDTRYAERWAEGRLTDPRRVVAELLSTN